MAVPAHSCGGATALVCMPTASLAITTCGAKFAMCERLHLLRLRILILDLRARGVTGARR